MGMSRGLDTIITFRVLKLLTTAWEDQAAFEHGLIDDKGKRIKSVKPKTSKEKDLYFVIQSTRLSTSDITSLPMPSPGKTKIFLLLIFIITRDETGEVFLRKILFLLPFLKLDRYHPNLQEDIFF